MPARTGLDPLPDPLPLGPFRFGEARAFGVGRHRLRQDDIAHPHHGLYVPADGPQTLRDRCERALPLLGEHRWYSHLTAARLWEMPLPFGEAVSEPLHVLTFPGAEPLRRPDLVGWESEDTRPGRALFGILPLIAPADVWCQLAVPGATGRHPETGQKRMLSPEALVEVGDYLLTGPRRRGGRRVPLCTPADLVSALARHRGKRGAKALAWALEFVRPGAQSPRETRLRLALIFQGLAEPDVQIPVETADGRRHADLGYPRSRVLIEYHGDHHRTDRRQWQQDLRRVQLFEDAGYRTLVATAADLDDGGRAFAQRVHRALTGIPFTP